MKAEFVLDYRAVPVKRARHLYIMAQLTADPAPDTENRRPLNIGVVLDRSGSMTGDKIAYVKQAAQFLVRRLAASDRFSLVSYNEQVAVDIAPEHVAHKDRLAQLIGGLQAGGTTNLSGGWLKGCELVGQHRQDGQVDRVLLLSDGLANQGITDPTRLEMMARQKRAEGITTTTMGVGMDFNEDLMRRMAVEGGGAFYFIDNPDQAPTIFNEELQDLLSVVGQNLSVTLEFSAGVRMVRQLNDYPAQSGANGTTFQLGDIFADEVKSLLVEVSVPAMQDLGEVEIGRLRFEYDALTADGTAHQVREIPVVVQTISAAAFEDQVRNEDVVKTLLLLQAARAREEAIQYADMGDYAAAAQVLGASAQAIMDSGIANVPELRAQHDMLREESVDMDFGAQRYTSYSRKASMSKSHYASTRPMGRSDESTRAVHARLRRSRAALERSGPTPSLITWVGNSLVIGDRITFGRDDDNDIVIAEEEVSGHHCEIVRAGDDLLLVDLNSTNGTYANGGMLSGRFRLSVGDVVTVGSQLFMFEGDPA
ncbi:MAG: VWA domain-containing protein [Anaerolineae bacterium]|nr:VWA domain-containing protein [Anaerolineae bacterium]